MRWGRVAIINSIEADETKGEESKIREEEKTELNKR